MYVEHPYKFNDKFYAKVDGKFYEITREVSLRSLYQRSDTISRPGRVLWKRNRNARI